MNNNNDDEDVEESVAVLGAPLATDDDDDDDDDEQPFRKMAKLDSGSDEDEMVDLEAQALQLLAK